jgi:asparagine synthetase B (glutamine-hydrolysing)
MYLIAVTETPLDDSPGRFGDLAVHQASLWSRHVTVVTDRRFSVFEKHVQQRRVVETIDPITTPPSALVRSEVAWSNHAAVIHLSMAPNAGGTLYYVADPRGNFYCSTRISLLRDAGVPMAENRAVIPELLCYTYVTPPNTMFANIKRLLLGGRMSFELKDGRFEQASQQFFVPTVAEQRGSDSGVEQASEAMLARMAEEVRNLNHLEGQVAVPMSGGTDSSVLWALCHRELRIEDSYSTGYPFEDPRRDREREYAFSAARAFGANHHFFEMTTEDYLRAVIESVHVSEEPVHMQAPLFQRQFADGLPPETRVLVSGQGADGINGFRLQSKIRAARTEISTRWVAANPRLGLRLMKVLRSAGVRSKQLAIAVGEHLALDDPDNTIWRHEKYGNEAWVNRYFGTSREQVIHGRYELVESFGDHEIYDRLALLYVYSDIAVAGALWSKIAESHDRGMLFPFTAVPVMEAALSIPWEVKLAELKKVLRGVARLLNVPEFILERPKSGLGIDPDRWAVKGGPLEPLIPLIEDVFDVDELRRLQMKPNRRNATTFWSILNYSIWKRLFIHNESVETLLGELDASLDRPSGHV